MCEIIKIDLNEFLDKLLNDSEALEQRIQGIVEHIDTYIYGAEIRYIPVKTLSYVIVVKNNTAKLMARKYVKNEERRKQIKLKHAEVKKIFEALLDQAIPYYREGKEAALVNGDYYIETNTEKVLLDRMLDLNKN